MNIGLLQFHFARAKLGFASSRFSQYGEHNITGREHVVPGIVVLVLFIGMFCADELVGDGQLDVAVDVEVRLDAPHDTIPLDTRERVDELLIF